MHLLVGLGEVRRRNKLSRLGSEALKKRDKLGLSLEQSVCAGTSLTPTDMGIKVVPAEFYFLKWSVSKVKP